MITQPMSFGPVVPLDLDEKDVLSIADAKGELAEDTHPAWQAAAAYKVGDKVHYGHRIYLRVKAGTSASEPPKDTDNWADLAQPTNRWAAFDWYESTVTEGSEHLAFTIHPRKLMTTLYLGELFGSEVQVVLRDGPGGPIKHDKVYSLLGGTRRTWYSYFFDQPTIDHALFVDGLPLLRDPHITITLRARGGVARVGRLLLGRFRPIGWTEYDADIGRISYSDWEERADGTIRRKQRPGAAEINVRVLVYPNRLPEATQLLARYEAEPTLWVASRAWPWSVLNAFGRFEGRISADNHGQCTLQGRTRGLI